MATTTRLSFSGEQRVMGILLLFVPATLIASSIGWPPALQFFLSVGAVIPLAAFVGAGTEALADRLGGKVGGLLNATFGNAPDLLVGVFGVQRGLIPLVKATIIGALISNSALIMGLCYIVAGLMYRQPRFKAKEAGHHSVLLMLAVAAVLFPSVGAIKLGCRSDCPSSPNGAVLLHASVAISIILLLAYVAYVAFGIFGWESLRFRPLEGEETHHLRERAREQASFTWPTWFAVAVLVLATVALIPVVDILTGSVVPVTQVLGWSQVFVGIVIVANAGNVAEGYAAVKFAYQRGDVNPLGADSGLDLALGIASASSIQIATFVAPVVVLFSLSTANPMNLVFSVVEIAILALLAAIFTYIAQDGESNWLEGAQLLALYLMAAVVFYALPASAFSA